MYLSSLCWWMGRLFSVLPSAVWKNTARTTLCTAEHMQVVARTGGRVCAYTFVWISPTCLLGDCTNVLSYQQGLREHVFPHPPQQHTSRLVKTSLIGKAGILLHLICRCHILNDSCAFKFIFSYIVDIHQIYIHI